MNKLNLKSGETIICNNSEYRVIENRIVQGKGKKKALITINVLAFAIIPAVFIIYFIALSIIGIQEQSFEIGIGSALIRLAIFFSSYIAFIVAHEYVHYLTYRYFGKTPKDQLKFGLALKTGMAYCIALTPNTIKSSRLSLMMPFYVLVIPFILVAIVLQSGFLLFLAALFASGSAGDFWYMWTLRNDEEDKYILESVPEDGGYDIGYLVLEKLD